LKLIFLFSRLGYLAKVPAVSDSIELQEIDLMPRRLMNFKQGEPLVRALDADDRVAEVLIHGPKYHDGKQVIGRFIIRLTPGTAPDEVLEAFKTMFESTMPFGYDVRIGRFTKPKPTVKDYLSGKVRG